MKVISQVSQRVFEVKQMEITASKERPASDNIKNLNHLSQRCYGSVIKWTKTLDGRSYHRRKTRPCITHRSTKEPKPEGERKV